MFTDGSSKTVWGWEQAGFGGFYGEGGERNFACPLDPQELQTNGRAEVRAVLFAMRQCSGANPMAIVTDSEVYFNGLTKHILLWERRDWPGISILISGYRYWAWPGIRPGNISFSGCHSTSP